MRDILEVHLEARLCQSAKELMRYRHTALDEQTAYALSVLSVYRQEKDLVAIIDNRVLRLAMLSHNSDSTYATDAYTQLCNVLSLINIKNDLLYLAQIAHKSLKALPKFDAALLYYYYVKRRQAKELAEAMGLARSVFYIKLNNALICFYSKLEDSLNGVEWAKESLFSQGWFYKPFMLYTKNMN